MKLYSDEHTFEIERIEGTDQYVVKKDDEFLKDGDNVWLMDEIDVLQDVLVDGLWDSYGHDVNENATIVPFEKVLKEMQEQNVTLNANSMMSGTKQLSAPHYTEKQVQDFLKEQIQQLCNEEGMRELYADRGEAFSPEFVLQIFQEYQENDNGLDFYQFLGDKASKKLNWEITEIDYLLEMIEDKALKTDVFLYDSLRKYEKENDIGLILEEAGYNGISYDIEDFLRDDYKLNLMLATEAEKNTDMSAIATVFRRDADDIPDSYADNYFDRDIDNALTWLIHQQGYGVAEVYSKLTEDVSKEEGFVASVAYEIQGCDDESLEVAVSVSASEKNLIEVLEALAKKTGKETEQETEQKAPKNIEVSKDSSVGLFNEWQGSGSWMEIQLEKPLIIPTDIIRTVQIETQIKQSTQNRTIDEAFSLVGSYWKGEIEVTDKQPELVHEDVSTMKEAFLAKNEQQLKQRQTEKGNCYE